MTNVIPRVKEISSNSDTVTMIEEIVVSNNCFEDYVSDAFIHRCRGIGINAECTHSKEADTAEGKKTGVHLERNADLAAEEYRIDISAYEINVSASTENGVILALATLYQMLAIDHRLSLGSIMDAPVYPYRGIHIDAGRHFFPAEEIKKILEEVSLVKINKLHWHLSDDQGWRIQIDKYPRLTEQNAANEKGERQYYTKEEIKDVVAFAQKRGIEVIPEIDMPGHTRAMTAAYPNLSCTGEKVSLATCGGIYPVILCPGKDTTFDFVTDILDEMVPLFPGQHFNIGGDEAPKHRWKECPDCQRRIRVEGLKDEIALQGYFSRRIADYITKKYGKRVICWNDSLEAVEHLNGEEIVQYWSLEHKKQLPEFIEKGGHFIYSDMFELYYDYPAAMSPMKRSYSCKPMIAGVDYSRAEAMLGFECCNWTEYTEDGKTLESKIFPRLYAMAEDAWSGNTGKTEKEIKIDYKDFNRRLDLYKKKVTKVNWGSGDPRGLKKTREKLSYAMTMSRGMSPEVREATVAAAQMSEEFMQQFKEKMLK